MSDTVQIPKEFGGSWKVFCESWCLGAPLALRPTDVALGLSTLKRIWPEEVDRIAKAQARSALSVVFAVELGLLLASCENVKRFQGVLKRLKSKPSNENRCGPAGEPAAYSELALVSALGRLGYEPEFNYPVGNNNLDAHCLVEGQSICFEVYAPEQSYAFANKMELAKKLTDAVRNSVSKCRVEIQINGSFDEKDIPAAISATQSASASEWWPIGAWGLVRRIDIGQRLLPQLSAAQLVLSENQDVQDEVTTVIVGFPESDDRAVRKLEQKRRQMSDSVANVVVMKLGVRHMAEWPMQLKGVLAAGYQNIGAVLFFAEYVALPYLAVQKMWRVLVNPHAHKPIAETLLQGFEALDESGR